MKWLNALEVKFSHLAIPGLIRMVILLNVLVFLILRVRPEFAAIIWLDPTAVMHGEVWRLVTYILIPPYAGVQSSTGLIWIIFAINFLWFIGDGLEHAWGAFKLNAFYFIGMLGCTVATFFFPGMAANACLNLTLLYAFATIYPN